MATRTSTPSPFARRVAVYTLTAAGDDESAGYLLSRRSLRALAKAVA